MIGPAFGLLLVLGTTGGASAHSPLPGIGTFYSAALHPLVVPAHLLVALAVGLLLGQHAPTGSRVALPAFAMLLAAGLLLPPALAGVEGTAPALLAVAALTGVAVALGRPQRLLFALLAGAAGLAIALDSRADAAGAPLPLTEAAGIFAGAVLAVTLSGGLTAGLRHGWQRIAVRALGSWIAAAAIIVLALALAPASRAG